MPKQEKSDPITSYDEYLRRYLPEEAQDASSDPDDLAKVGEEVGRRAVERAVAKLTSSARSLNPD